MTPTWIESVAYELAEKIQYQMEKAYNAGYDDGKGQAWSEEIKKYEIEPEKVREAELRGAESAWNLARHLFNVGGDVTDSIYMSMNGGKGLGVAFEMSYAEAAEKYEAWKRKKDKIYVGDEVAQITNSGTETGLRCVVTQYNESKDSMRGLKSDGDPVLCGCQTSRWWKKTGRHFTEVAELFDRMENLDATN